MNRFFSFCMALLIFSACSIPEKTNEIVVINDAAKARLDSTLAALVSTGKAVGVSALIHERGQEVYYSAHGHADREAGEPMERSTIVRVFSMTKPVTGVALMKLYEQGKFDLDDPLEKYAPEFANPQVYVGYDSAKGEVLLEPARRAITIRDITRHTAGFATGTNLPGLGKLLAEANPGNWNNTLPEMARKLASVPLMHHPGEKWEYGPAVDVQAYLVEVLSGQPYGQFVQEQVLDPLAMTTARYFLPEGDRSRLAASYLRSDSGLVRQPDEQADAFYVNKQALTPGGWGLTATLDDYGRFAQMLVNGGSLDGTQILRPETVKLMATNHLSDSVESRSWLPSKGQVGFGIDFAVRVRPPASAQENNGTVGEFFWDGAASTLFWVDPANELTAVFLVQVLPFDGSLHKAFRDAVYGPVRIQ